MKKYLCVETEGLAGVHVFVHHESVPPEGYKEISLSEMNEESFHKVGEKVCVDVLKLIQDLLIERSPVKESTSSSAVTRPDMPSVRPRN